MKNLLIALFLLVALTVDVPANDIYIDNSISGIPADATKTLKNINHQFLLLKK